MKKLALFTFLLVVAHITWGQADCLFDYAYKIKITRANTSDTNAILIKTPSVSTLQGYSKFREEDGHLEIIIDTPKTFYYLESYGFGADFCASSSDIINTIFKKNRNYVIVVKSKSITRKFKIKTSLINFSVEGDKVIIELPALAI